MNAVAKAEFIDNVLNILSQTHCNDSSYHALLLLQKQLVSLRDRTMSHRAGSGHVIEFRTAAQ